MTCYTPMDGWRRTEPNYDGKYPLQFHPTYDGQSPDERIACGQCIGCRLEHSRQWAMRCVHEASLHDQNSFITLTYDEEHLPLNKSLNKRDWQLFVKRLRKHLQPHKIRFFMCGEYGEDQDINSPNTIGRPHYHAIIFNYDFPDKTDHPHTGENPLYTSPILEKIWGKGFVTIGEVTFESAAYVARYCMKKITGDQAETHYQQVDPITGEITNIRPEFTLQSRNPGIARNWYLKYKTDLNKGFITMRGIKLPIPKAYIRAMEKEADEYAYLQHQERVRLSKNPDHPDNTPARLLDRENIKRKKLKLLQRNLQ